MSTSTYPKVGVRFDWLTGVFLALVAVFHVGGVLAALQLGDVSLLPTKQIKTPSYGVQTAGIIVVESLVLIVVYRYYSRLPDWVTKLLKYTILGGLLVTATYLYALVGQLGWFMMVMGAYLGFFAVWKALKTVNLDWITFNALVITIGIAGVAVFGTMVAPTALLPLLVLLIVWDHVAVNLSDIMAKLINVSSSIGIPNYLVIPNRLRVDFEAISDFVEDSENTPRPEGVASIIGLGDFVLPGALTVSAWVAGQHTAAALAFLGTAVAMVVLRDAMQSADGAVPALPWLNTGAICGFASGVLLMFFVEVPL